MIVAAAALATAMAVDPALVDGMRWYRDRPVAFVRELLGGDPTPFQAGMLEDLVEHKRVAAHTGHRSGKTTDFAWAALWYSCTRPYSKVIDTAPTFKRQVKLIFWPELRKWAKRLPAPHGFQLGLTDLVWDDGWFITGQSAAEGENIAGFHSDAGVMVIVDEAAGVEDVIFEALEGALSARTGEYRLLIGGQPSKTTGVLFEAREKLRSKVAGDGLFRFHHQSALDSPLVDRAWCEERRRQWGEDSPAYRVRVLGLPPATDANALIPYEKIHAAVERWKAGTCPIDIAPRYGVDVAYQGDDDSVLARRFAHRLESLTAVHGYDSIQVGDLVMGAQRIERVSVSTINVDGIGYGAGTVARLRECKAPVNDVNVGSRSSKPDDFENLRAELCWAMREWFMSDTAEIPDDADLIGELGALRTVYLKTGRVGIEPKLELKKRLGRSPDRADALMLTFGGRPVLKPGDIVLGTSDFAGEAWRAL